MRETAGLLKVELDRDRGGLTTAFEYFWKFGEELKVFGVFLHNGGGFWLTSSWVLLVALLSNDVCALCSWELYFSISIKVFRNGISGVKCGSSADFALSSAQVWLSWETCFSLTLPEVVFCSA